MDSENAVEQGTALLAFVLLSKEQVPVSLTRQAFKAVIISVVSEKVSDLVISEQEAASFRDNKISKKHPILV